MRYEVEQKYRVDDPTPVAKKLAELAAEPRVSIDQRDRYFAHPSRDFAETDEALRLRRVGESNVVTYKGPKVDAETKTRREIELPLSEGGPSFQSWSELLSALGFEPVLEVAKSRTPYRLVIDDREVEVVLDEVAGLGSFVEIETQAGEDDLAPAKRAVEQLAERLGLRNAERRSYLELLLAERDGAGG